MSAAAAALSPAAERRSFDTINPREGARHDICAFERREGKSGGGGGGEGIKEGLHFRGGAILLTVEMREGRVGKWYLQ